MVQKVIGNDTLYKIRQDGSQFGKKSFSQIQTSSQEYFVNLNSRKFSIVFKGIKLLLMVIDDTELFNND